MSVVVVVPAAGMGSRMRAGVNKQYLTLGDRPLLAHTLALFDRHPAVDRVFVVVPADEIDYCRREVVERYALSKVAAVVAGGAERQDSVRNGLAACTAAPQDIVLIHDGARPLLPPPLVDRAIEAAVRVGGCLAGVPVKDTIKEVDGGLVSATPDRRRLWQAQTPQAFRFAIIRDAHERAAREGFRGTDDAALVERPWSRGITATSRSPRLRT